MDALFLLGMIAVSALLAIGSLYVLATRFRDERSLHDLAVDCHTLRLDYARRINRMSGRLPEEPHEEIEVVEEAA